MTHTKLIPPVPNSFDLDFCGLFILYLTERLLLIYVTLISSLSLLGVVLAKAHVMDYGFFDTDSHQRTGS